MIKNLLLVTFFTGRLLALDAEFKPIFNGEDFDGWWGLGTENPAKWMALPPEKLVVDDAPLQNYFDKGGPLPKTGPIQLQTHGAEIHWRNVMVKEL